MKKALTVLLAAALGLSLTACTSGQTSVSSGASSQPETSSVTVPSSSQSVSSSSQAEEPSVPETKLSAETSSEASDTSSESGEASGSDILIVYFTAAENSGVEAIASASYTMMSGAAVGRVRAVADMIQAGTGGDLFSVQTSVVYPADGGELIEYAAAEQEGNARPELTSHIENLDQYQTIFIGYPTWWYDMPQVMYSFFDEYDLSGKTIIPFNVHNGSRFSGTISTIKELEPGATVIDDGFTVSESTVAEAAESVSQWLQGLGYGA